MTSSANVESSKVNLGKLGALATVVGGAVIVGGSMLPWMTMTAPFVGTISKNGLDSGGDGIITLILGSIAFCVGAARFVSPIPWIVQAVPAALGAITGLLMAFDLNDVIERVSKATSGTPMLSASVGVGIYASIIGALLTIAGGLMLDRV